MNRMCGTWAVFQLAVVLSGWTVLGHAAELEKSDANRGKVIVTQVCAACHGADGNSAVDTYPKLAGQHAEYLAKQLRDFKARADAAQPARNNAIMAGMAGALSDQQIADVTVYFASQTPKPGYAHDRDAIALGRRSIAAGLSKRACLHVLPATGPVARAFPLNSHASRGNGRPTRPVS